MGQKPSDKSRALTCLKKEIDKNRISSSSTKFIPESSLANLITPQVVREVLGNSVTEDQITFFCEKAFKVFAILARRGHLDLIRHMYEKGLEDKMLPVERVLGTDDEDEWQSYNEEIDNSIVRAAFQYGEGSPWGEDSDLMEDFCDSWQWQYVSPVFVSDSFRYRFPKRMQLPFTNSGGRKDSGSKTSNYSYVEEKSIHAGHIPRDMEHAVDDDQNPRVAIKTLTKSANVKSIAEGEAAVLELIKESGNVHLVKAIAYYQKGDGHYFIFPWAELGNLSEFLRKTQPRTDNYYVIWVFEQLTGVAGAIEQIHHHLEEQATSPSSIDSDSDFNIRHGDLKPENILCFKRKNGKEDMPRLVITDVGLAKRHNKATEFRSKTTTTDTTKRYEAPELGIDPEARRSRRFDIWSLGCIYLEVVIWLLYGPEIVQDFANVREPFYETTSPSSLGIGRFRKKKGTASLHPNVTKWISYLKEDWRCADDTAVRRLIELIATRFLVIQTEPDNSTNLAPPNSRTSSSYMKSGSTILEPVAEQPSSITAQSFTKEPDSLPEISQSNTEESVPKIQGPTIQSPATSSPKAKSGAKGLSPRTSFRPIRQPTWSYGRSKEEMREYRAYATEMRKELETILSELVTEEIKAFSEKPSKDTPTPKGLRLGHAGGTQVNNNPTWRQNEYRFTPLNDNWDYIPDDAIAKRIFANISTRNMLPQPFKPTRLCSRCASLQLWSMDCVFIDSLEGLIKKFEEEGCEFCRLLSKELLSQLESHSEFVRFARVSSYLTIDDGRSQAVANIYTTPDSQSGALQDIQIGFPQLPPSSSETYFKVLTAWIRCCDNDHRCYPKDKCFIPTRLLDVNDGGTGTVKLMENGHGRTSSAPYVALSHRWGSPLQDGYFCTYTSNIEDFKNGIDANLLPKTFQDAVEVTRAIGVQYLWIDSLCIVQNDGNDWAAESKLMEHVFSSAYCTIAASRATGSGDGFLKPRLQRQSVSMTGPENGTAYYVCETIDDFHTDVERSGLNQRGWVLQERALSRRTIYFTETQSYWECGEGVRCETMTKMKNRKASFLGDSNFPTSAETYVKGMRIELFQNLYERYSKLLLSYPSDRPIAIRGLETRLLRTFRSTGGYGIFDRYLHRSLLWERSGDHFQRIMAPSWSWMAYEGPIKFMAVPFGEVAWCNDIISPFAKVKQANDTSRSEGEGEPSSESLLEMRAPVWDIASLDGGETILDDPKYNQTQRLQCMVVGRSKVEPIDKCQACYVLLVQRVAGVEDQVYERIGVGVIERHQIALEESQREAKIR